MQPTNNDNIITDITEEEDIISIVSDLTHPIYLDDQEQAIIRFRAIVNSEHTYQQTHRTTNTTRRFRTYPT